MANHISSIHKFLSIRLKNNLEKLPWKMLELNYPIADGLTLSIKNRADWNTYSEIFVRGDYNWAIEQSLKTVTSNTKTFRFLDLGANVGFFSLKLVDAILKLNNTSTKFEGVLVEGSPSVYRQLQNRLSNDAFKNIKTKMIHGLAGKRSGEAKIYESSNYITNSLSSGSTLRRNISGKKVSYIDIESFFGKDDVIDILKCDIEGSELEFLENYENLLPKVKVAVFELHHDKCDTNKCIEMIMSSGLVNRKTIFTYGDSCSLEVFSR